MAHRIAAKHTLVKQLTQHKTQGTIEHFATHCIWGEQMQVQTTENNNGMGQTWHSLDNIVKFDAGKAEAET